MHGIRMDEPVGEHAVKLVPVLHRVRAEKQLLEDGMVLERGHGHQHGDGDQDQGDGQFHVSGASYPSAQ